MENTKNSKTEKFDFEPIVYRKVVHSRLVCLNGRIYNLGTFNSRDAAERAVADFNARKQASIKEKLKNFFCF